MQILWWSLAVEGVLAVGLVLLARAAPEGFEDGTGFHYVRERSGQRSAAEGPVPTAFSGGGERG